MTRTFWQATNSGPGESERVLPRSEGRETLSDSARRGDDLVQSSA